MNSRKSERRIAIFVPSLGGGGAEKIAMTLANSIHALGKSVDVVLGTAEGPFVSELSRGVRVIDLESRGVLGALIPLARYLRRQRPKAVLSMMTHANVVALIARRLSMVDSRLVVSERSTISVNASRAAGVRERLLYRLAVFLYPRADAVLAVSSESAQDLAEYAGIPMSQVESIYNPFDLERIESLAAQDPFHPWFSGDQPPVITALGRLEPEKDFATLIRAFSCLRKHCDARLMILGEGNDRVSLESLARGCGLTKDCLEMPGFVMNPYMYLARSRLFVLSSQWEGLPGALIEALACGVPVVSTDCKSGPREILEDGRWGALVPVGDVHALEEAMFAALSQDYRHCPGGRKRARDFSVEKIVAKYLEVLDPPEEVGKSRN